MMHGVFTPLSPTGSGRSAIAQAPAMALRPYR
uniref:Uncharacterized protein n=1 Tax=Anguilla anguilla TaxID=7936 RepID=A0A0E9UP35_ANGAN